MESSADSDGQTDSVEQNYGGGCATRRGMERATETKQRWVGCTQGGTRYFLFQPSLPLIQATLVRGAFVLIARVRPVFFLRASLSYDLYEKRFSYRTIASTEDSVKGQVATNDSVHSRIGA